MIKKNIVIYAALLSTGVAAGWLLHKVQDSVPEFEAESVVKTIIHDTIAIKTPESVTESSLASVTRKLPLAQKETADTCLGIMPKAPPDSVEVEIPITHREYGDSTYHAWVSGYEPRLDSIFVFPTREREVVTIKAPPDKKKRWGIGLYAGYGITPQGLQPSIGISLHYSLWNF